MRFSATDPTILASVNTSIVWVAISTFILLTLRHLFNKHISEPLGHRFLIFKDITNLTEREKVNLTKFGKYLWHALIYSMFLAWNVAMLYKNRSWVFNLTEWVNLPAYNQPFAYEVKYFIWIQTAWYMHGMIETMMTESRRMDFVLMVLHHAIAGFLLYFSWYAGYAPVGVLVTANQDVADIVLYLAKILDKLLQDSDTNVAIKGTETAHTFGLISVWVFWTGFRWIGLGCILYHIYFYIHMDYIVTNILYVCISVLYLLMIIWGIGLNKMLYDQLTQGTFFDYWHDQRDQSGKKRRC